MSICSIFKTYQDDNPMKYISRFESNWIFLRYCPAGMFIAEALSKVFYL